VRNRFGRLFQSDGVTRSHGLLLEFIAHLYVLPFDGGAINVSYWGVEAALVTEQVERLNVADKTHSSSSEHQLISQDVMCCCTVAWPMTCLATQRIE
jgi:hypothetical protein